MKLFINASLPTSSSAFKRVNVLFDDKIIKISNEDIKTEEEPEVIDLKGKILLPGAIDPHLHTWEKLSDIPKTITKATQKAISGGWTTVAELSYNCEQPIFNTKHLSQMIAMINEHSLADVSLWGNVDIGDYPYHAEAAQDLWGKGVVGIALMTPSPNPNIQELSFTEIMDLFMDIYESDTEFAFQGSDMLSHDEYSFEAQRDGIKKLLRRMQENPIHIPRVSSFSTIEFINSISKRSDISFAISISDLMHFFDSDTHPALWDADLKDSYELLFELIRTNKIYLLSNCAAVNSLCDEVFRCAPIDIMQYSYLWVISELWKTRKIPLATCIKMTSENAAKRLGIYPQKGCLEAGSDADFVIYDPEQNTTVKTIAGKDITLLGKFEQVYLRGKLVNAKSKPAGQFVSRSHSPKRRHNNTTWI